MGWAAIIAALVQLFGPVLVDWLRKWFENRLKDAAELLPDAAGFASEAAAGSALIDEVIDGLPRLAFARRALLRRFKAVAASRPATGGWPGTLTPAEVADMTDAARAAENE